MRYNQTRPQFLGVPQINQITKYKFRLGVSYTDWNARYVSRRHTHSHTHESDNYFWCTFLSWFCVFLVFFFFFVFLLTWFDEFCDLRRRQLTLFYNAVIRVSTIVPRKGRGSARRHWQQNCGCQSQSIVLLVWSSNSQSQQDSWQVAEKIYPEVSRRNFAENSKMILFQLWHVF